MDRLFDDFFLPDFSTVRRGIGNGHGVMAPRVNVSSTDEGFVLEMAAPGWTKSDFNIQLDDDLLTVSAELKVDEGAPKVNYSRKEFGVSSFQRSFRLPEVVDGEKIAATYENGILKVDIPKKEEAKPLPPKSISIA